MIRHPRTAITIMLISLVITAIVVSIGPRLLVWIGAIWVVRWMVQTVIDTWWWYRMHHNHTTRIRPDQLKVRSGVYIGHGFRWTSRHTSRLLQFERAHEALPIQHDDRSGSPALHAVGVIDAQSITIPPVNLSGHIGIQGMTQVGKSEELKLMTTQAIHQCHGPVVVIDPKGGAGLATHAIVETHRVGRQARVLCPALPNISTPFDPLSTCSTATEVAQRIRTLFPEDTGRYQFFTSNPVYLVELVAHMQRALGETWSMQGLYRDAMLEHRRLDLVLRYIATAYKVDTSGWRGAPPTLDAIRQQLRKRNIDDLVLDEFLTTCEQTPEHFNETHRNLSLSFSGIINTEYSHLFEPHADSLTWEQLDRDKMVLIVLTHSLLMRQAGNKIGRLVLQDLMGYAAQRYLHAPLINPAPITAVIDEVGEVAYPDFIQAINKTGEAGVRFVMAWQSESDLSDVLGRDGAESLLANVGNRITLRLASQRSAEAASRSFGEGYVREVMDGTTMTTHGRDSQVTNATRRESYRRMPLIPPGWFKSLPKGEGFALLQGAIYKFTAPLLSPPDTSVVRRLGFGDLLAVDRVEGDRHDALPGATPAEPDRESPDPNRVEGQPVGTGGHD